MTTPRPQRRPAKISQTFRQPFTESTLSNDEGGTSFISFDNPVAQLTATILLWAPLIIYTFLVLFGQLLILPRDETDWCRAAQLGYPHIKSYPNPDTNNNPCYKERTLYLLGLTLFEADFSRRMISAVIMGSLIGYERKAADRPAGVRTMALVCLGAAFFTMCGQHAFDDSPQCWDAARVSAAIPSGVGFLGSALIWKHTTGSKEEGNENHEVHGLTTAASVWLSASIGIGVGGHLYIVSVYAVTLVIFVLRLGPRMYLTDDTSYGVETESEWEDTEDELELVRPTRQEQLQMLELEAAGGYANGGGLMRDSSSMRDTSIGSRRSIKRSSSAYKGPIFHD